MTIYIRPPSNPRWCTLGEIAGLDGRGSHITTCGARMDAAEPYVIVGAAPAAQVCAGCRALGAS